MGWDVHVSGSAAKFRQLRGGTLHARFLRRRCLACICHDYLNLVSEERACHTHRVSGSGTHIRSGECKAKVPLPQTLGLDERHSASHRLLAHVRYWQEFCATAATLENAIPRVWRPDLRCRISVFLLDAQRAQGRMVPHRSRERSLVAQDGKRSRRRRQDCVFHATAERIAARCQGLVCFCFRSPRHNAVACAHGML